MNLPPPVVSLAITSVCPHCPTMLEVLGRAVKKGDAAELHVINIEVQPEYAQARGIRSVPWMKIGPFILSGLHQEREISTWLERARSEQGMLEYLSDMLSNGQLEPVIEAIHQSPESLLLFIPLISNDQTNINIRLGMAAIMEEFAGRPELEHLLEGLLGLLEDKNPRVRGDAAHFLSFINSPAAIDSLKKHLDDDDENVREIAEESLQVISDQH